MLQQLFDASLSVRLRMNMSQTKVIMIVSSISNATVVIEDERLETDDQYVYLGYDYNPLVTASAKGDHKIHTIEMGCIR